MTRHPNDSAHREPAIVVGGGLAGLAAAVGIASAGVPVDLLESRTRLGGRASSFLDPKTNSEIDNCQHVSLGCCNNFRHFCEVTGLDQHVRTERVLNFIGSSNRTRRFHASPLPAPLHLAPAFFRLDDLTFREKRQLASGLKALCRERPTDDDPRSFAEWLVEHNQPAAAIKRFWEVVLISALSEDLNRIAVRHARKVFVEGFLATRDGWEVDLPTIPLSRFYGDALQRWFDANKVSVTLNQSLRQLRTDGDRVTGLEFRDGAVRPTESVILAVPQYRLLDVLPSEWASVGPFRQLSRIETAPISSVHLWFDRDVTELPHAVFTDRLSQWMFNRSAILSSPSEEDAGLIQVVISASRDLVSRSQDEVIAEVMSELAVCFPAVRDAKLIRSRMITEKRAVFSVKPGIEALRMGQRTGMTGLFVAGDWTRTGWPATMEGAIKSGFLAAAEWLADRDIDSSLAQPDVRPTFLSRMLMGL